MSGRAVLAGVAGAAVTAAVRRAADRSAAAGSLPGGRRWERINHRGAPISLLEGPSVAAGLLAASAVVGGRTGAACAVAATGGATFGLLDDLSEDTSRTRKGLRGHLGALRHGEVTTGALKVLGIGASGLVAAAVAPTRSRTAPGRALDVLTSGALVAATANLLNLLDLRPGRALKAAALVAAPFLAGPAAPAAAAVLGSALAAMPADLAERDMLGDGGANAMGAVVGVAAATAAPRPVRLALLAGAVGLTLASERVSFTAVIARTPVLREIDAWGRR